MSEREFGTDDLPDPREIFEKVKQKQRFIWLGIAAILVVVLALSSWFTVEPDERAIVLRFGAPIEEGGTVVEYKPGLHFKIPLVDDVNKVAVERQYRLEFGFRSDPGKVTTVKETGFDKESLMLTGDLQLVHVRWSIIYQIRDPRVWLFDVKDQEATIRDITMAVMRQLVGDYSLNEVLTVKVREIQQLAKDMTNAALQKKVPTGVAITELAIKTTDVPQGAREAFDEFNRTEPEVRRTLAEAKAAQHNVTGDAELKKKQAVGIAEKDKAELVLNAEGEAAAFEEQLDKYLKAPEITRQWMYLQTMTNVMTQVDKVILEGGGLMNETVKLLPLTDMLTPTGKQGGK